MAIYLAASFRLSYFVTLVPVNAELFQINALVIEMCMDEWSVVEYWLARCGDGDAPQADGPVTGRDGGGGTLRECRTFRDLAGVNDTVYLPSNTAVSMLLPEICLLNARICQ